MDLFGQIFILDLGAALGRYITHYRREFFDQSGYGGYEYTAKPDAFKRITDRIKPLVLRLSAEAHLKMPKLVYQNIMVDLPPAVMQQYKAVEDDFFAEVGDAKIVAGNKAVAGGKCRQIANGACYVERNSSQYVEFHDAKLDALEDLIDELGGKPILVLYEFQHDKERLLKRFPQARVLGSGTSAKHMEETINGFNSGKYTLVLGHPASMGHGLNLQGRCHHLVWFGIPWDLDFYDQATARINRQGQQADTVFVYHIVGAKTLDERVLKVLTLKDRNQQTLLSALGV